ncbi:ComEA family DNA-binding protein [Streptomyces morookaense]|uniref:ComEA family DNA-binding protein n=1 Tax=Streptomyces morookaense TaxID=1970 RepID=A0A7Y7B5I2_STRMO|nr:ComEA family DNA-binding protein [Streptomyces morookaense]NVK79384.1 ComEA family DNA-binding protein [Streptomyces morookaense]
MTTTTTTGTRTRATPRGDWRLAARDRIPLWLQTRCGFEPRTLAALTVVLVAAAAFAAYHFWQGRPQPVRPPAREAMPVAAAVSPAARRTVVVDVAGKVQHPGVLHLPQGARVADALEAAGGARPGTDTTALNRARVLADGEQIVVGAPQAAAPGGTPGGAPGGPVSLNSATQEQLQSLPGVGPVLAKRILDYRAQHGGFHEITDLRQVTGIGAHRFSELRTLVQP